MEGRRTASLLLTLSLVGPGISGSPSAGDDAASPREAGPVVLELFTSQGCSSCLPADRVLSRLGLDEATRTKVVPLAFHVDYWNGGGWTDPFSSREWSLRQEAYGRALKVAAPYTPQLVVGGRTELNGSNEARIRAEIAAALERPSAARIRLGAQKVEANGALAVEITVDVGDSVPPHKLKAMVALFENGVATAVARGENQGHTLQNDFIVRRLESAFTVEPKPGAHKQQALSMKLDRTWKGENMGVAAFLQDPDSMRIYGAAIVSPLH